MELTTLQTTVASAISGSNESVTEQVINFFKEKEVTRRVTALTTAITDLEKQEKDLQKIKPDQKQYDGDGKVAAEFFSEVKNTERKKLLEKTEKLRKAVTKALESNDFGDLFNLSKPEEKSDKPVEK